MLMWFVIGSPLVLVWTEYPAQCFILLGLSVVAWSFYWSAVTMRDQNKDPDHALTFVQGFRIMIVGLCVAGLGAGWLWDSRWLVGLSLIIGAEELLESSVIIKALKESPARRA